MISQQLLSFLLMTPHFFSIVYNINTSTTNLENELNKIKNWAIQLKMNFNFDPSEQAPEVIFSRTLQKANHNQVCSNHNPVKQVRYQKHLAMYLDTKLNFQEHLNNVVRKIIFIKKYSQYNMTLH